MMNRVLLTVKEASELTGLTTDRIYELCRRGPDKFPHVRFGPRQVRIPKKGLLEFLGEHEPATVVHKMEPPDPRQLAEALIEELRKVAG